MSAARPNKTQGRCSLFQTADCARAANARAQRAPLTKQPAPSSSQRRGPWPRVQRASRSVRQQWFSTDVLCANRHGDASRLTREREPSDLRHRARRVRCQHTGRRHQSVRRNGAHRVHPRKRQLQRALENVTARYAAALEEAAGTGSRWKGTSRPPRWCKRGSRPRGHGGQPCCRGVWQMSPDDRRGHITSVRVGHRQQAQA